MCDFNNLFICDATSSIGHEESFENTERGSVQLQKGSAHSMLQSVASGAIAAPAAAAVLPACQKRGSHREREREREREL